MRKIFTRIFIIIGLFLSVNTVFGQDSVYTESFEGTSSGNGWWKDFNGFNIFNPGLKFDASNRGWGDDSTGSGDYVPWKPGSCWGGSGGMENEQEFTGRASDNGGIAAVDGDSLMASSPNTSEQRIYTPYMNMYPGETYKISFYYTSNVLEAINPKDIEVYFDSPDGTRENYSIVDTADATGIEYSSDGWQKFEWSFTVPIASPSPGLGSWRLDMETGGGAAAHLYMDQLQIQGSRIEFENSGCKLYDPVAAPLPPCIVRDTLNWDSVSTSTNIDGFDTTINSIKSEFALNDPNGWVSKFEVDDNFPRSGDTNAVEWVQDVASKNDFTSSTIKFDQTVSDLCFTIRDIDDAANYGDSVSVIGYHNGNKVKLDTADNLQIGNELSFDKPSSAISHDNNGSPTGNTIPTVDAHICYEKPIDSIKITFANNKSPSGDPQNIALSDFSWRSTKAVATTDNLKDTAICGIQDYTFKNASAKNYDSLKWKSGGSGSFNDASKLKSTYTPSSADSTKGSVNIQLKAFNCLNDFSIMSLSIVGPPKSNAGSGGAICQNSSFTVSGASVNNETDYYWIHDGNGTLTDSLTLTPTYNAVSSDAGSDVSLSLIAVGKGNCKKDTSQIDVTIQSRPTTDAGSTDSICINKSYKVNNASASNYNSVSWSDNGNGSLSDTGTLTPTYKSVAGDTSSTVNLFLTANGKADCPDATDTMDIEVEPQPKADAGNDVSICDTSSYTVNDASASNYSSVSWSHNGSGSLSDTATLTPTYKAATGDFGNTVTLTLMAEGKVNCSDATDQMNIQVKEPVYAGKDNSSNICDTSKAFDLQPLLGGNETAGGNWENVDGAGTLNGRELDASGVSSGTYEYQYIVLDTPPCSSNDTASIEIAIDNSPYAGKSDSSAEICSRNNNSKVNLFNQLNNSPSKGGTWYDLDNTGDLEGVNNQIFNPDGIDGGLYDFRYVVDGGTNCPPDTSYVQVKVYKRNNFTNVEHHCLPNQKEYYVTFEVTGDTGYSLSGTKVYKNGNKYISDTLDKNKGYNIEFNHPVCGNNPNLSASGWNCTCDVYANISEGGKICSNGNGNPQVKIEIFNGTAPYDVGYEIDGKRYDTTGINASTLIIEPDTSMAGDYTVVHVEDKNCVGNTSTDTVSVKSVQAPDAGENDSIRVCNTTGTVELISVLSGNPDKGGVWKDVDNTGGLNNGEFDVSTVNAGTYAFDYIAGGSGPCNNDTATVYVIVEKPAFAGNPQPMGICDTSKAYNLFNSLTGNYPSNGTWKDDEGTGRLNDSLFDAGGIDAGNYQFTYKVKSDSVCPPDSSTVTVSVDKKPEAGQDNMVEICDTTSQMDLFNYLAGSPDSGGDWLNPDNNARKSSVVDSSDMSPGTFVYTYIVSGGSNCPDDSAKVTVDIKKSPDAGQENVTSVCDSASDIKLFTHLKGNPDKGGAWKDIDNTNNLNKGIFEAQNMPAGSYDFNYEVKGGSVCPQDKSTVTINIKKAPDAGKDNIIKICNTDNAINLYDKLGGSPQSNGNWFDDDNSGGLNNGYLDPSGLDSGDYRFTYVVQEDKQCTSDSAKVTVSVEVPPVANAGLSPQYICNENSSKTVQLEGASVKNASSVEWHIVEGKGNLLNKDQLDASYKFGSGNNYKNSPKLLLEAKSDGQCKNDSAIKILETTESPEINVKSPGNVCQGNIYQLSGDNIDYKGGVIDSVKWHTYDGKGKIIENNIKFPQYQSHKNDLKNKTVHLVANAHGCKTVNDTVSLNIKEMPYVDLGKDIILCEKKSVTLNAGTQAESYNWNTGQTTQKIKVSKPGFYSVKVYGKSEMCMDSSSLNIKIKDDYDLIDSDSLVNLCNKDDKTYTINTVSGLKEYKWYRDEELLKNRTNDTLIVNKAGFYKVVAKDSNQCRFEDTVSITKNCASRIYVPDVFTPNGDGINDKLKVFGNNIQIIEMIIFNRWGEIIFVSHSKDNQWDGTYKNQKAPEGSYSYKIIYKGNATGNKFQETMYGEIILSR